MLMLLLSTKGFNPDHAKCTLWHEYMFSYEGYEFSD